MAEEVKDVSAALAAVDNSVATPCADYLIMEGQRQAPRTLMGGTTAMRAASELYLPKKPAESQTTYDDRLRVSVLFNAFKKSIKQLTGKVFSKPIGLDGADDTMEEWSEDIDLQGNAFDVFARALFEEALTEGLGFILVDYPHVPDGQEPETQKDLKAAGSRPYWVRVAPKQVIGWRSEVKDGARILTQVRIAETYCEPSGMFGEVEGVQIRVLTPGAWQLWRQKADNDKAWEMHDEGATSLDFIPLVPFYTGFTGFMTAEPPLIDLADLNIKHWQSQSSQDHILDYVRFPILFARCLGLEEGQQVVVGPNNLIKSESENAELKHVEHTGASIDAGRQSISDLEARMAFLALEPMLQQQSGSITATKTAVDSSSASSMLMAWAVGLKDALEQAWKFTAAYTSGAPEIEVEMNFDFVLNLSAADATILLQSYQAGAITRETYLEEMMRRGILSDDLDVEAEGTKLDQEAEDEVTRMADAMKKNAPPASKPGENAPAKPVEEKPGTPPQGKGQPPV